MSKGNSIDADSVTPSINETPVVELIKFLIGKKRRELKRGESLKYPLDVNFAGLDLVIESKDSKNLKKKKNDGSEDLSAEDLSAEDLQTVRKEIRQDAAAVKIQKVFRGQRVRDNIKFVQEALKLLERHKENAIEGAIIEELSKENKTNPSEQIKLIKHRYQFDNKKAVTITHDGMYSYVLFSINEDRGVFVNCQNYKIYNEKIEELKAFLSRVTVARDEHNPRVEERKGEGEGKGEGKGEGEGEGEGKGEGKGKGKINRADATTQTSASSSSTSSQTTNYSGATSSHSSTPQPSEEKTNKEKESLSEFIIQLPKEKGGRFSLTKAQFEENWLRDENERLKITPENFSITEENRPSQSINHKNGHVEQDVKRRDDRFERAEFAAICFSEKNCRTDKKIFNNANLFMANFRNCVFEDVDFSRLKPEVLDTIVFCDCEFRGEIKFPKDYRFKDFNMRMTELGSKGKEVIAKGKCNQAQCKTKIEFANSPSQSPEPSDAISLSQKRLEVQNQVGAPVR